MLCLLMFACLQQINAGMIYTTDYSIDFINVGFTKQLTFYFNLQNGLGKESYLSLLLPFALPDDTKITYNEVTSIDCSSISILPGRLFNSFGWYHFLFLQKDGSFNSLLNNQYYALIITSTTPLTILAQVYTPIQAQTIADYSVPIANWIVYDMNRIFAVVEFVNSPANELGLMFQFASLTSNDLNAVHNIYLDITPQISIEGGYRIIIRMLDQDFKFWGDLCFFVDSTQPNFPYVCAVQPNLVEIRVTQGLLAGVTMRYKISIANPPFVKALSGGFEIFTMLQYANIMVERGVQNLLFSTNSLKWNSIKSYFAWDLIPTDPLPSLITIYRSDKLGLNPFFNSIRFSFQTASDTPLDIALRVVLLLDSEENSQVLEGSIIENLPQFSERPVCCKVDLTNTLSKRLICTNVGTLYASVTYSIGIKIMIPYNKPASLILPPDSLIKSFPLFGSLAVETWVESQSAFLNVIPLQRDTTALWTTLNCFQIINQSPNNGFSFIHSQVIETNPNMVAVTSSTYGIHSSDRPQRLILSMYLMPMDVSQSSNFDLGWRTGFDMYTSPIIQPDLSTAARSESLSTGQFSTPQAIIEQNTVAGQEYTRFRIGVDTTINLNLIFAPSVSQSKQVGVGPFYIRSRGTQYASVETLDFFGGTFDNVYNDAEHQIVQKFAFNSFTVIDRPDALSGLTISVMNFWTGPTMNLNGNIVPAFIRVSGSVTATEIQNATKIALFFSGLDPFVEGIDDYGRKIVACSATLGRSRCTGFSGSDVSQQSIFQIHRVEFDISTISTLIGPASPFQLLIPVKTIPNQANILLQLGVMIRHPYYQYKKDYHILSVLKSNLKYQTFSVTASDILITDNRVTSQTYALELEGHRAGDQDSDAQIKVGHIDTNNLVQPNTNILVGGGFYFQGQWNMVGDSFKIASILLNNEMYSLRCLGYSYYSTQRYWGFFCPFYQGTITATTAFQVLGFNYPSNEGVNIPPQTYGGWSSNSGALVSFRMDITEVELSPGLITQPLLTQTKIKKGWADQKVTFYLTTANSIPSGGTIRVKFGQNIVWNFQVQTRSTCVLYAENAQKQLLTTCAMESAQDTSFQWTITSADGSPFSAQTYRLVQYGVTQPNSNGVMLYYTIETTLPDFRVIDQSVLLSCTIMFENTAPQTNMVIQDIKVPYTSSMSRGVFELQFQCLNRGISMGEWLRFDISLLASNNIIESVQCFITKDGAVDFKWRQLVFSSFAQIELYPREDMDAFDLVFVLQCQSVTTPPIYRTPSVKMLYSGGTVSTLQLPVPTFVFGAQPELISPGGFQIYKTVVQAQAQVVISLSLSLSFSFNSASALYIGFPLYYNVKDNEMSLICEINGESAYCLYAGERLLKIKLFSFEIQEQTSFSIKIQGVLQPSNTFTNGRLIVMADDDDDPKIIRQLGLLDDIIPIASDIVAPFKVNSLSVSNEFMRELSQFNFTSTASEQILQYEYIFIDFPKEYGLLLQMKPPSLCRVSSNNGATIHSTICSTKGNSIQIKLEQDILLGINYLIEIFNLTNPEQSQCELSKTCLLHLSLDNSTVYSRSSISASNLKTFKFSPNPELRYTFWRRENSQTKDFLIQSYNDPELIILNRDTLELVAGQFSGLLSLGLIGRTFNKILTYNISSTTGSFEVLGDMMIYPGDGKEFVRIGCTVATFAQLYFLNFIKEESGLKEYADFSLLSVNVVLKRQKIGAQYSSYSIPLMTTSPPIIFDFSEYIPVENVVINFNIMAKNALNPPGLRFVENNTTELELVVNRTNFIHSIHIESFRNVSVLFDSQASLLIQFFGPGSINFIQSDPPIQLILTERDQQVIEFTMSVEEISAFATKQILTFQSNVAVHIFYIVCIQGGPTRDLAYVMDEVNSSFSFSEYFQEQFGQISILQELHSPVTALIKNLKARTWYRVQAWAVDRYANVSISAPSYFVTQSNNGRLMRLSFSFSQLLDAVAKESIACWLCTSFSYSCLNTLTSEAIFCRNSSQGDFSSNQSRVHSLYDSYRALQSQQESRVSYYFVPLAELDNDESWSQVVRGKDVNFESYFLEQFSEYGLLNIEELKEVIPSAAPEIITEIQFNSGLNWISIENIGLKRVGMVWGYITQKFNSTVLMEQSNPPTPQQIKYKSNCLNQSIEQEMFIILPFEDASIVQQFNISGLSSGKWYTIYLITTSENPSLWSPTSQVFQFKYKTQRQEIIAPIVIMFGTMNVIVVILLLFI